MSDAPVMLITGASSGIGAATAHAAAAAGYRLVLTARSVDALDQLAAALPDALAVPGDVTRFADQERAVACATEAYGRLDVAFANAGVPVARGLLNESPERWQAAILTNVLGVALTARAALPALKKARGHLLMTGGVAGKVAVPGSVFAATKAAVASLAESARGELEGTGVRVTLVAPGITDTPFFDNPQADALHAPDVAGAVMWAIGQPPRVDVNDVLVRSVAQRYP